MSPVRVLLVEDSATARLYLTALLEEEPGIRVIGTAKDGAEGVALAESLRPDVVLMDVHMPHLDGFEATRRIMERCPTRVVMISASLRAEEVAKSFRALGAGALTLLDKPPGPVGADREAALRLVQTVRLMAEVRVVRRWAPRRPRKVPSTVLGTLAGGRVHTVAIGASTGGPAVVAAILRELPAELDAAVLYVQHIAPGFVGGLAEWLDSESRLPVSVAADGEPVEAGRVYVAPEGVQMGVRGGRIRLSDADDTEGFRPSVSWLLRSVAESDGPGVLGVLLTGMGRDGAAGLLRLRQAGGVTLVQSEETSPVFGMPAEGLRLGAAELALSPVEIAEAIRSLAAAEMGA